ncbi:YcjX family protein [Vibrio sp. WJH972]
MIDLTHEISDILNRTVDGNIKIAVTGLSRAGKTAFITSLVNQLLHTSTHQNLPFLNAQREHRLIGAKRVSQQNMLIPSFNYDDAMTQLQSTPPQWPVPTRDVSEIRLALKYRTNSRTKGLFGRTKTLYLDIVDYPGEWLLDLPMLNQSFEQWSQQQFDAIKGVRKTLASDWLSHYNELDFTQNVDDGTLTRVAESYTEYLNQCKTSGLHWAQPGRFVLPGELAGAPVLQFFPVLFDRKASEQQRDSSYQKLRNRYQEYQSKVIKAFYEQHFSTFDRQIVLVDCLTPLNHSDEAFSDMRDALEQLLTSFKYGRTGLLGRLFSPKIDKVLFAATKADHITPDQHENLVSLLTQLVHPAWQQVAYQDIELSCASVASIRATKSGKIEADGESHFALRGRTEQGNSITLYPGDVPPKLPEPSFWKDENSFNFRSFMPPHLSNDEPLPHIRMDSVLDFLLGDKLR